jgi:hypothetical protein
MDRILRGGVIRRKAGSCSCGGRCPLCSEEEDDRLVRRWPERPAAPRPEVKEGTFSAAGGVPLPQELRAPLERSFGRSLSEVRLHLGESAGEAARALGAKAFTLGTLDVYG